MNLCVLCLLVVTLCYVSDVTKAGEWSGPKWKETGCGCSKFHQGPAAIQPQIIAGEDAQPHEFPWQVLIIYTRDVPDEVFGCGGTLISECYVLTAAHCATVFNSMEQIPAENYTLHMGLHNLNVNEGSHVPRKVIEIIRHPDYNITSKACDAALFRLDQPVQFNENVTNICKPNVTDLYENEAVYVTGWGIYDNEGGIENKSISSILQIGFETIIPNSDCPANFNDIKFMCMKDLDTNPQSACFGDGGGPVAVKDPDTGKFSQIGIISFVLSPICNVSAEQGLTRITQDLLDWIDTC